MEMFTLLIFSLFFNQCISLLPNKAKQIPNKVPAKYSETKHQTNYDTPTLINTVLKYTHSIVEAICINVSKHFPFHKSLEKTKN